MNKFFIKLNNNKTKKGFTLIETLVAVSIFVISIIAMMAVLSGGLSDTISAKKRMSATFLAQEGVEYIRNIRDTYVLYWGNYTDGWNKFNTELITLCGSSDGCFLNDEDSLVYTDQSLPITKIFIKECVSVCPNVFYNNSTGKYNSSGSGNFTDFVRKIEVKKISDYETKVTSTVFWDDDKSIALSESLFNWVE